jgi:hypothetical protein
MFIRRHTKFQSSIFSTLRYGINAFALNKAQQYQAINQDIFMEAVDGMQPRLEFARLFIENFIVHQQ